MDESKIGVIGKEEEKPLTLVEQAKNLEEKNIGEYLKTQSLNPESENINPAYIMTPGEHKIIGSSYEGMGYHLNQPMGIIGGVTLEKINQQREKINSNGGSQLPMPVTLADGRIAYVFVKFLPLTKKDVDDQAPKLTVSINRFIDFMKRNWGKEEEITDLSEGEIDALSKQYLDLVTKAQEDRRRELISELEKASVEI